MRQDALTISTYRPFPSNAIVVSTIADNRLITRTYIGYTNREAIREFKRDVKQEMINFR